VLTVSADRDDVERMLGAGGLACPACGGPLARWGRARERQVRGLDGVGRLVPRRARCGGCGRTHVLLPVTCLARRADEAEVIGRALEAKAAGAGHRVIAEALGRPASTVRGWLRALAARAEQVRRRGRMGCGWRRWRLRREPRRGRGCRGRLSCCPCVSRRTV